MWFGFRYGTESFSPLLHIIIAITYYWITITIGSLQCEILYYFFLLLLLLSDYEALFSVFSSTISNSFVTLFFLLFKFPHFFTLSIPANTLLVLLDA